MAGTNKILDTASAISATRTAFVPGSGGHAAATFFVFVTAITRTTGSLNLEVKWTPDGSATDIQIGTVTGITATGLFRLTLSAGFNATRQAIPEPNKIVWTLVGDATAVSGTLIAQYGD